MGRAIQWQPQLSVAGSALNNSTYTLVGHLITSARCIFVNNLTNADIQLSITPLLGGTFPDNLPIAARTGEVLDIMANSKPGNVGDDGAAQAHNTFVYAKLITVPGGGTTGSLYISYWNEIGEL